MSYNNDFKRFEFDFKFAKSSKYVALSKKDFVAILHYITLPDELQVIFFSLLCVPAQITVKLIKLITTTNLSISYKKLAQELSVDENLIKLRLSNLYESGFPIELTEINVRMKTQPEGENEVKRLSH
jgi:hypothetical protein